MKGGYLGGEVFGARVFHGELELLAGDMRLQRFVVVAVCEVEAEVFDLNEETLLLVEDPCELLGSLLLRPREVSERAQDLRRRELVLATEVLDSPRRDHQAVRLVEVAQETLEVGIHYLF